MLIVTSHVAIGYICQWPPGSRASIYDCGYGGLSEVPGDIPPETETLVLTGNNISSVEPGSFKNLTGCKELDLGENRIANLKAEMWEGLMSLEQLGLYFNPLNRINPGDFQMLSSLLSLDLSYCWLTELHMGMFHGLGKLKELTVIGNHIVVIQPGFFKIVPNLV